MAYNGSRTWLLQHDKPGTPVTKSSTPTSSGNTTPGPSGMSKHMPKPGIGTVCPVYFILKSMLWNHLSIAFDPDFEWRAL